MTTEPLRTLLLMACNGKQCVEGTYIQDDFDEVCLSRDVVERPPIELWPQVVRRIPVPTDVEEQLIQSLERSRGKLQADRPT